MRGRRHGKSVRGGANPPHLKSSSLAKIARMLHLSVMNVSIIGTGYVGLTTGACLAFLGHKVTCIDSDEKKVALLQAGKTPIYEPFLTELLEEARPNLQFCRDYAAAVPTAEVIFIAVGT